MNSPSHNFIAPRRKWNWRAIVFLSAIAFVIGYPIYVYVAEQISSGITKQGDLLVVDLKSMSSFEMDQNSGTNDQIPSVYRALDGKRVQLVGQMYDPNAGAGDIRNFVLCYSINNCCFNGPPKVQHLVQATVLPSEKVEMHPDYVEVTGTLHVGVQYTEGHVQSVYRLDVERVVPE